MTTRILMVKQHRFALLTLLVALTALLLLFVDDLYRLAVDAWPWGVLR